MGVIILSRENKKTRRKWKKDGIEHKRQHFKHVLWFSGIKQAKQLSMMWSSVLSYLKTGLGLA